MKRGLAVAAGALLGAGVAACGAAEQIGDRDDPGRGAVSTTPDEPTVEFDRAAQREHERGGIDGETPEAP